MFDRKPVFTLEEIGYALLLASQSNPDDIDTDAAKALIYKARSIVDTEPNGVRIGPFIIQRE